MFCCIVIWDVPLILKPSDLESLTCMSLTARSLIVAKLTTLLLDVVTFHSPS